MSTYYASKKRKQVVADQIFILTYIVFVFILTVFPSPNSEVYNNSVHSPSSDRSLGEAVSFTTDAQYWRTHCSYGWESDSACDDIVSRAQVCHISLVEIDSAYCTEYHTYMERFHDRLLAEAY